MRRGGRLKLLAKAASKLVKAVVADASNQGPLERSPRRRPEEIDDPPGFTLEIEGKPLILRAEGNGKKMAKPMEAKCMCISRASFEDIAEPVWKYVLFGNLILAAAENARVSSALARSCHAARGNA